ncbi:MAG: CIA30 family protein [Peristeroidobacter soli]
MSSTVHMPASRLWDAYLGEMRFEFIKALRTPQFSVPTIVFPIMFYVFFSLIIFRGAASADSLTAFAKYGVFGCMGPGLFGFGVALAVERELGLLTLKQALPSPPGSYLIARAVMAMLFVSLISIMLITLAVTGAHVPLTFGQAASIFFVDVLGTLPFCAIGMFVGAMVSGQGAIAICNLIFLLMSILSALWFPVQVLPKVLVDLLPVWPSWHLSQLAMRAVDAPSKGSAAVHVTVLAVITVVFFFLAMRRLQGGGYRLLGARPQRTLMTVAGSAAVLAALMLSGVFGGKPANTADATAATDAATATADTPAPNLPAGVAAPGKPDIASFDEGSANTAYGFGWTAAGDEMRGGDSHATQQLVDGGADGTKAAHEVTGAIGEKIQYPFAGTMFFPEGPPMKGYMDYSGKKTLTFQARGDSRRYMVMVISGLAVDSIPLMYDFPSGPEWHEVKLTLADFSNVDWTRVRAIGVGTMGPVGPFRFQIDNVRLE